MDCTSICVPQRRVRAGNRLAEGTGTVAREARRLPQAIQSRPPGSLLVEYADAVHIDPVRTANNSRVGKPVKR